jgi:hypothetical protein
VKKNSEKESTISKKQKENNNMNEIKLTEKERIEVAREYCKNEIEKNIERIKNIGTPLDYCYQQIIDKLEKILKILQ